jgi:hypothetical protein
MNVNTGTYLLKTQKVKPWEHRLPESELLEKTDE